MLNGKCLSLNTRNHGIIINSDIWFSLRMTGYPGADKETSSHAVISTDQPMTSLADHTTPCSDITWPIRQPTDTSGAASSTHEDYPARYLQFPVSQAFTTLIINGGCSNLVWTKEGKYDFNQRTKHFLGITGQNNPDHINMMYWTIISFMWMWY